MYAVIAAIMVRDLFRTIEYIQGHQGYILANQWPMLVFTTIPFVIQHPHEYE